MSIEIQAVDGHELGEVDLAVRSAEMLNKHYPGHMWAVHVDSDCGMLYVRNLMFSTRYGYKLKLTRVYADPDLHCIMIAGGEILERASQPRGWWKGKVPDHIEGVAAKHQPFHGIPI